MKPTLPAALLIAPLAAFHAADCRLTATTKMIYRTIPVLILLAGVAFAAPEAELVRELKPLSVRAVNYFPRETPWCGMWTKTPPDVFEQDMALIARTPGALEQVRNLIPDGFPPRIADAISPNDLQYTATRNHIARLICKGAGSQVPANIESVFAAAQVPTDVIDTYCEIVPTAEFIAMEEQIFYCRR